MTESAFRRFCRQRRLWLAWALGTALAAAILAFGIDFGAHPASSATAKIRGLFSPAAVLPGHASIRRQCGSCHDDGTAPVPLEAMQEKCIACHGRNDDNRAENTHPRSKFEDPSNIGLLKKIDAAHCVTCHGEHRPAAANHVGLTIPRDFCVACHREVAKDAPSHRDMDFATCTNTGCHSFHDNRGTYRKLLRRNIGKGEPDPSAAAVPAREFGARAGEFGVTENPHGTGQVGECKTCHAVESAAFGKGRHGAPAAVGLGPIGPAESPLPFTREARAKTLGCTTCHDGDKPDLRKAAVEACVSCHADRHTRSYAGTGHERAWRREVSGEGPPGSGVSCATCHMPRHATDTEGGKRVVVNHENSMNLRPAIKQARVCISCHSLQFSHDALADDGLAQRNFDQPPRAHVKSIEMEAERNAGHPK